MNNDTKAPRSTHTATTTDNVTHAFNPVNTTLRCGSDLDYVRNGRNFHTTVTCTACYADLTRLRTR